MLTVALSDLWLRRRPSRERCGCSARCRPGRTRTTVSRLSVRGSACSPAHVFIGRVADAHAPIPSALSLDDLHDLRTRSLHFIHNLLNKLRAAGVRLNFL